MHLVRFVPLLTVVSVSASIRTSTDNPATLNLIDLETASIPTREEAAVQARKLLLSEKISTLSTVFPSNERNDHNDLSGSPIGLIDYYADCSTTGDPTLLAMNIATSFRNSKGHAPISLSIRAHKEPEFYSPAAHPRLALIGRLVTVEEEDEKERLKECFVERHPDARIWLPGNEIHFSYWVKLEVEKVYMIGGFGNVAYIGWLPKELWGNATLSEEDRRDALSGYSETGLWDGPSEL